MIVFRFIAVILLALALMAFGADTVASLEKGDIVMRSLHQDLILFNADPTEWLETTFPAAVVNVLAMMMNWPAFAVLGVLGLALGALSLGRIEREEDADAMPEYRQDMRQ